MKCTSFAHLQALFGRPRIVSYALGSGPRRGPACTPWRKRGSRPGSVARALGVQSCAICQVITWSFSAELEPARPMETPKIFFFSLWRLLQEATGYRLLVCFFNGHHGWRSSYTICAGWRAFTPHKGNGRITQCTLRSIW